MTETDLKSSRKDEVSSGAEASGEALFVPRQWCYPLYSRNIRLEELLAKYVKGCVLDYGCAGGKRFSELKSFGASALVGFDILIDPQVMSRSKDVSVVQADGNCLSFNDNSFDFILANHVIEHIPDMNAVFSEVHRTLKPGGKLLLGVPTFSAISFYFYYPAAVLLYKMAKIFSRNLSNGGAKIVHGKRLGLVGDADVLKVTSAFERILAKVPTVYLKTVFFSVGFTLWGAIFNHRDHRQKHNVWWWKERLIASGLEVEGDIPVGGYPLFISNLCPRFSFPFLLKAEGVMARLWILKPFMALSRDHFLVASKK